MSMQNDNEDFEFAHLNDNSATTSSCSVDTRGKFTKVMGIISRLTIVLIILHVVYLAFDEVRLFSLHPACMAMGYLLFMMEAILSLSQDSLPVLRNVKKITAHWTLQVISSSLISIGFLAIVINKYNNNYPHFVTWHGFIGLIAVCAVAGTNFGGISAKYSLKLKSYIRPSIIKACHSFFGIVAFLLGLITIILGFYSNWFVRNANEGYSLMYSFIILILGCRILITPFKNVITRLKSS